MGNLRRRVLPTLTDYVNGRAGAADVAGHMWAKGDFNPNLSGLRKRRAVEKGMFTGAAPVYNGGELPEIEVIGGFNGIQRAPDDHNAALARDKAADEYAFSVSPTVADIFHIGAGGDYSPLNWILPNVFKLSEDASKGNWGGAANESIKMFLPMNNAFGHAAQFGYGLYNLVDENGIPKTVHYFQNGQYGRGALSAVGDVANAGITFFGGRGLYGDAEPLVDAAQKAYKNRHYYLGYANDHLFNRAAMQEAMNNGTYIYDRNSYIRNVLPLMRNFRKGQQQASNEFFDITGYKFEPTKVSPVHGSRMKSWQAAYYDPKKKTITVPVTERHSNIARNNKDYYDILNGGHEQAHANNDALLYATRMPTKNPIKRLFIPYSTNPPLGVWSQQRQYYMPNRKHPVANQFYDDFMKVPPIDGVYHGSYPEETWANFMGYRALQREGFHGLKPFSEFNQYQENVPSALTYDFINNYVRYLKDTYNRTRYFYD